MKDIIRFSLGIEKENVNTSLSIIFMEYAKLINYAFRNPEGIQLWKDEEEIRFFFNCSHFGITKLANEDKTSPEYFNRLTKQMIDIQEMLSSDISYYDAIKECYDRGDVAFIDATGNFDKDFLTGGIPLGDNETTNIYRGFIMVQTLVYLSLAVDMPITIHPHPIIGNQEINLTRNYLLQNKFDAKLFASMGQIKTLNLTDDQKLYLIEALSKISFYSYFIAQKLNRMMCDPEDECQCEECQSNTNGDDETENIYRNLQRIPSTIDIKLADENNRSIISATVSQN